MTKDRLISAMSRFCPPIIGECPKCGEPIFKGQCCFRCGLDTSDKKVKNIKWEEAFKASMVKYFSDKHNIVLQPKLLNEAIKWWKMKVIFKRPLKQDDAKSWRMIEKYCLNKHQNI